MGVAGDVAFGEDRGVLMQGLGRQLGVESQGINL